MKITWITRSFLDYRIPVFEEINRLCENQLTVVYSADIVPKRCQDGIKKVLGGRAIGLSGEFRIGGKKIDNQTLANTGGLRIITRPGLIKKVKNTNPDILLTDGFFQWTYAALVMNALWGTRHIMCYERTLHTERNVTKIRTLARKMASRFINGICCNGIQTKEYLEKFGFPGERLFLGNLAADSKGLMHSVKQIKDLENINLKRKYQIKGKVFLYVGQLIPRKGIMEMLKAWKDFNRKSKDATLVLVGQGTQEEEEEALEFIRKNKLGNVVLTGSVDYSEIASFYAAASIFIVATLEDNWSLVVPEAMSCGLPIISSKYNGCWPELVKSENGWVFDPLNPENFRAILESAWSNRDNWQEMGNNSLKIIQDFTPEKVSESIYSACHSIINN